MLAVVLLIVVILVAVGVHSCQVSATDSALKDYTNHVSSVVTQSSSTGKQLFGELAGGAGNPTSVQTQINNTLNQARSQYGSARNYNAPDQVSGANRNFVLAMRMRYDAIANISNEIQPALGTSASQSAVNSIAAEMARFYASDVLYKDYAAPAIAGQLHANGIAVGANGVTIAGGQFLTDVQWLTPTFVATELHVTTSGGHSGKIAPGVHGHTLNSVSVAGTTLQTGSTNTITASPAPTFDLDYTNGGTNNETNVVCKVTVNGSSVSGTTTIPETVAGQNGTCKVTLSSTPPTGTQTVVATIEKVPGEKNTSNNSLSYTVTFQ